MGVLVDICRFIQYGDLPTSYFTKRGMKVGKNFCRQSGTRLDPSHCWLISIGDDVTLANKVQILAHDDSIRVYTGYGKIGPVRIGSRVFVGANSTILMNTTIGDDVIIGAGSVVTKDIPDNCVVAGVPAKIFGKTSEYIQKNKLRMNDHTMFDKSYSYWDNVSNEKKEILRKHFDSNVDAFLELGIYRE